MAGLAKSVTPWPKDAMNSHGWPDSLLLRQTATEKEFQPAWQADKYLLRGKMLSYIGINEQIGRPVITTKLEPLYRDMLRREHADIVPGYYMNKQHWSSVYLDGNAVQEVLADMVCASYNAMLSSLSKRAQREILKGWVP